MTPGIGDSFRVPNMSFIQRLHYINKYTVAYIHLVIIGMGDGDGILM